MVDIDLISRFKLGSGCDLGTNDNKWYQQQQQDGPLYDLAAYTAGKNREKVGLKIVCC